MNGTSGQMEQTAEHQGLNNGVGLAMPSHIIAKEEHGASSRFPAQPLDSKTKQVACWALNSASCWQEIPEPVRK